MVQNKQFLPLETIKSYDGVENYEHTKSKERDKSKSPIKNFKMTEQTPKMTKQSPKKTEKQ